MKKSNNKKNMKPRDEKRKGEQKKGQTESETTTKVQSHNKGEKINLKSDDEQREKYEIER